MQHPAPEFGIRCLKRYINGGQVIFNNPLHIPFGHIGKRHIITLKEGKSGIIILKIKAFPHSLRHLIDKAENTFIAAGTVFIHQSVFKGNSQILFIILIYFQEPFFTGGFATSTSTYSSSIIYW